MDLLVYVLTALARHKRRLLLATILVTGVSFVLLVLFKKRQYRAEVVIVTVSQSEGGSGLAGVAASLSGAGPGPGFLIIPELLTQLATSRRVLLEVGESQIAERGGATVVAALTGNTAAMPSHLVERRMHQFVSAALERRTGLITIMVAHRDSALARLAVNRVVDAVSRVAVTTARAQAAEERAGQELRVDSAGRTLEEREKELIAFARANRVVTPYSLAALERDRLVRNVGLAQQVYSAAVNDREAARARELERTPAVVVVDPIPRQLRPLPRRAAVIAIINGMLFFAVYLGIVVGRGLLQDAARKGDPAVTQVLDLLGWHPKHE
jgi:hypothetical protein